MIAYMDVPSSHRDAVSLQSSITFNQLICNSLDELHPIHIKWDNFLHQIWKMQYQTGLFQEEVIFPTAFSFSIHISKEWQSSDAC